jgi:hypothetical protein
MHRRPNAAGASPRAARRCDESGIVTAARPSLSRHWPEDTLLRRIERIYDAALVLERRPEFLEALADVIDGHVANLAFTNPTLTHTAC